MDGNQWKCGDLCKKMQHFGICNTALLGFYVRVRRFFFNCNSVGDLRPVFFIDFFLSLIFLELSDFGTHYSKVIFLYSRVPYQKTRIETLN